MNKVKYTGVVESDFEFHHQNARGYSFYLIYVATKSNGKWDSIPVMVPGSIVNSGREYIGKTVEVTGRLGVRKINGANTIFIDSTFTKIIGDVEEYINEVEVSGIVQYVNARTVRGKHFVCGKLEVEKEYTLSDGSKAMPDGIVFVAYGRLARELQRYGEGDFLKLDGKVIENKYISSTTGKANVKYQLMVSEYESEYNGYEEC